jgi:hypothetical protein
MNKGMTQNYIVQTGMDKNNSGATPIWLGKKGKNRRKNTDMYKIKSISNEGSVISTGHFRPEVAAQI